LSSMPPTPAPGAHGADGPRAEPWDDTKPKR
jgi:hypothetical protein